MWIKKDKTSCENCGIHMASFYEYEENYLCPECTAEMNEYKEFEEC
jgi:rubredoxin